MNYPLILFTHIRKTGGTSFKESLVYRNVLPGEIYRFSGIKNFCQANLAKYHFVDGHYSYGMHNLTNRSCLYLTLLREPLDQAISYYYFIKQSDYLDYKHPRLEEVSNQTFAEFWSQPHNYNPQTKAIAGFPCSQIFSINKSYALSCLLTIAKHHLKNKYLCYGILEKLSLFESQVSNLFGWEYSQVYSERTKTKKRPTVNDLNKAEVSALKQALSLDLRLYEWAEEEILAGRSTNFACAKVIGITE